MRIKIPKSMIIYVIEYYLSSLYKNREKWIELQFHNMSNSDFDYLFKNTCFRDITEQISNLLTVLKMQYEEYEDYKETLKIFENINKNINNNIVVGEVVKNAV